MTGMWDTSQLQKLAADLAKAEVRAGVESAAVVRESGQSMLDTARALVPVDTGELRSSLTLEQSGERAVVSAGTDHGFYVEFGTSKMAPEPYLGPALAAEEPKFLTKCQVLLGDLLR